ncbi:MAG TPA: CapA family protein [Thermomicrobiales bacterium]|nr:CapA family protein [Thermomicrobiales bacterium]
MPIDYDRLAERLAAMKTSRRNLGIGAAGAVMSLGGVALLGTKALGNEGSPPEPTQPALAIQDPQPTAVAGVANAPDSAPAVIRSAPQAAVPDGMALVSSPRLPLFDLASQDVGALVSGKVPSWIEVGSALDLAVSPVAINGATMDGLQATDTFADYKALADYLNSADGIGGVALVPADQVDARVNVLAVDGYDPVRDGEFGEPTIRIGFVGDIVPGRNVGIKMREYNDYTHPFHRVAAILSSYDLTIANLEGDLSDDLPVPTEGATFDFVASTAMIDGLEMSGIDAVSQANNHSTWNSAGWGTQGLTDTIDALDARGFGHFGGGRTLEQARAPYTTTVAGKSIAIIGIDGVTANVEAREPDATVNNSWLGGEKYAGATNDTPGTYPYDPEIFLPDIQTLAGQYDIVIPYFHFGREYIEAPPDWAVDGARSAIDAGATLVVTNHPHVIQGMEFYSGTPILYSVGNFIFDQLFSVQTRQGLILELVLRGGTCVGLRTRGVEIEDFNQPRLMNAGEQAAIMDRFWASTDRLATR